MMKRTEKALACAKKTPREREGAGIHHREDHPTTN
jgi:hypothetical protein